MRAEEREKVQTVADIRLTPMPRQSRTDIKGVAERIREARRNVPPARTLLVAETGIDGSGKGFVASRIVTELRTGGLRAEPINIDGWLNLPNARFNDSNPADHFYEHAIRFEELFTQLVLPLRNARSLRLEADFAEETATKYRRHVYRTIYFPAQRLHFRRDHPKTTATLILDNDPRLLSRGAASV